MKRNKKMTGGPRGGPSWLRQALNLSELRFPPLSNEGPTAGMISGHSASSKTLRFYALPFPLRLLGSQETRRCLLGRGQSAKDGGSEGYEPFPP